MAVYENQLNHDYLPYILINNLKQFNLLDRIESKVLGFIDCRNLIDSKDERADKEFNLDQQVRELKIKSFLDLNHQLYRLDILSKYFYSKKAIENEDDLIENLETAKEEAIKHEEKEEEFENDANKEVDSTVEDTIEQILIEAQIINETKDYLTVDELRNLYLIQKLKYQFRSSKTYNPIKKAFPRENLRKKPKKLKRSQKSQRK